MSASQNFHLCPFSHPRISPTKNLLKSNPTKILRTLSTWDLLKPTRRISANMTCCCPQKLPLSSQGIHQKFIHFRLKHFNIDSFRPSGFDTWIGLNRSSLCAVGPIYHTLAARLLWSNFDLKIMRLRLRQCKYPGRRKLIFIFCFTNRF